MANVRRVFVVLICATLLLATDARCAWACDCDVPPAAAAIDGSAAIFAGEVTSLRGLGPNVSGASTLAVTFAVSRVWKGDMQPTTTIFTAAGGTPICGYEFEEGQEYLVYARLAGTTLRYTQPITGLEVSFCSRTQPLANATADLAALGDGQAPASAAIAKTPQPSALPNTSGEIEAPALNQRVLGALSTAVVLAGYMLRKRLL